MQTNRIKLRKRPNRKIKRRRQSIEDINFKLQIIANEDQKQLIESEVKAI